MNTKTLGRGALGATVIAALFIGWSLRRPPASAAGAPKTTVAPSADILVAPTSHALATSFPPANETARLARIVALAREKVLALRNETDDLRKIALEKELRDLLDDSTAGALVRGLSPDLLDSILGEIALTRWAAVDRRAAADWMAAFPAATDLQAGYVMYGWLKEDREGMHAYIDGLPAGPWKEGVLKTATNDALLAKDGVEAIGLLQRLPSQPQRNEMMGWAATEWARQDPASAAEWALKVTAPKLQEKLIGAVIVGRTWTEPAEAARMLLESLPPGETFQRTLDSLTYIWAEKAPAAVATWITRLPDAKAQEQAVKGLVSVWGNQDFAATQAWVTSLPGGPLRENAEFHLGIVDARRRGIDISDDSTEAELKAALAAH